MAQATKKFTHSFNMDLSEKKMVNGKPKHVTIATVAVPLPTLADFGINATQDTFTQEDIAKGEYKDAKVGEPKHIDGVPVYTDVVADWLQQAIAKSVAAYSRNRFAKGVLKPGMTLAEDFEALTAESKRTGEALALRREARTSFEAYLQKLGKKQSTTQQLGELFFNSAKVLATAGEKYVEALAKYTGEWIDTLDEAQKLRFTPKLAELQDSINAATESSSLPDDM